MTAKRSLVTARGHVEAWQAGRVVRADQMTFNRETGVVVATGNVVMVEANGMVMFREYARADPRHEPRHSQNGPRSFGSQWAAGGERHATDRRRAE